METYIYSLDCPITGEIKYIGKTINIKQRYSQHLRSNEKTKKYAWIKSLENKGLKPTMSIVDIVNKDWGFWEDWYIQYYKFLGFDLKNHKSGGAGGCLSLEVKQKISEKLKGKPKSEEHKNKTIKNLIPGNNKGKKIKDCQKEKLFNGLRCYIEKNGYPMKGKVVSNETKEKILNTLITKYGFKRKIKKFKSFDEYNKHRERIIECFDLNGNLIKKYKSIELNKKQRTNIISCANGRKKTAYGYIWKYSK